MKIEASAPANIALIKYMGKTQVDINRPSNASLSYTLEHLRSFVTMEECTGEDCWAPLPGFTELRLSEMGKRKFLNHFTRLKSHWNIGGSYRVCSSNNFPADCGIASSASSFAALTIAAHELALRKGLNRCDLPIELSRLSRLGSGSSCRSFFTPWALWQDQGAEALNLKVRLEHAVIIAGDDKKSVSSSEAHKRVPSSLLFQGRKERAELRLARLIPALRGGDWSEAFELCWSEMWDMHALFATSRPAFQYMNSGSLEALDRLLKVWREAEDGPLVTMDAGPNVHILLRADQLPQADGWLKGFTAIKSWA